MRSSTRPSTPNWEPRKKKEEVWEEEGEEEEEEEEEEGGDETIEFLDFQSGG